MLALAQETNVPKTLRIAKGLALPLDVVTQTLAILARKGSGKTFTLRLLLERLFRAGMQVVDLDPKGDHWGVRSSADGKGPGIGCLILGGEHGDLPLEPGAGELVAKLVVEERVSVVLDLSLFRKHEVATFCTAFLENFYRLKAREAYRTPVMLFVDEADAVAPQKPQRGEERMLGAIEDIVRRGRQRGIGCTLVTQRSAVLNKNVLTQAQVMIAMRTIAPQDLAAMDAWIEVHGTPEQRATLMESLPSLPRGDAWVWSPGWPTDEGIFQRVHVDPIETFDSGATPAPGEKRVEPKERADVDLEALRRQMAATVERVQANDPAALRRRVAELERDLAKKPAAAAAEPTKADPKLAAQVRNLRKAVDQAMKLLVTITADGFLKAGGEVVDKAALQKAIEAAVQQVARQIETKLEHRNREVERLRSEAGRLLATLGALKDEQVVEMNVAVRHQEPYAVTPARPAPSRAAPARANPGSAPEGGLDKAQRAILAVLAQFPEGRASGKLTLLSGYRWSGGFRNALSALRTAGLIEGANTATMTITDAGRAALGDGYDPLPTGRDLVDYWLAHRSLGACERAVLRVLLDHPRGLAADDLTKAAGYEWSGGFRNALSSLRTAGLLVGRNGEVMRACDELLEAR
jgi:hypothetical protein